MQNENAPVPAPLNVAIGGEKEGFPSFGEKINKLCVVSRGYGGEAGVGGRNKGAQSGLQKLS